ncbi:MAG: hypothetical protein ACOX69_05090 [Coriobacteriales bacterium]|jgi:hypothetical protein
MDEHVKSATAIERRFHGSVILMVLHLRRIAHSNDLEAGFAAARKLYSFSPENEQFVRSCIALDERFTAGESISEMVDDATIARLQDCARKINSADPA